MFQGNVMLRRAQYRIADSDAKSCAIALNMITEKVFNKRYELLKHELEGIIASNLDSLRFYPLGDNNQGGTYISAKGIHDMEGELIL